MSPNVHNANELKLFMDWFRETYGREWTISDELMASRNGAIVATWVFGTIIVVLLTYSLIKKCIKYAKDRKTPTPIYTREDLGGILLVHILPIYVMVFIMIAMRSLIWSPTP